jgi:leucine dehydrogenase
MSDIESLISRWNGAAVLSRFDRDTDAWMFVALHDLTMGTASGGTRMKVYESPAEGLRDAMRLAEGMTWKWASIALPHGGGKAVIALSRPLAAEEREAMLERYGAFVDLLGGRFATGVDLGTTTDDMTIVARRTRHVHGVERPGRPRVDAGPLTARGVFAGLAAAVKHRFGRGVEGCHVLVQGVGGVGRPLAELLQAAGARLTISDLDPARAQQVAEALGAATVPLDAATSTACDVFSPCAVGGILNQQSITTLGAQIVAGSANNQLASAEDADRLHARGILYVPDYVINAGGALAFGLLAQGKPLAEVETALDGLGAIVAEILEDAASRGESPAPAAQRRAEAIVAAHRRGL